LGERANILLITTDQQRFDTIAALGNEHIYTPHLDWLSDEGITFQRAYADAPICMPSRATLMTGKHGFNSGLTGNSSAVVPMQSYLTLPALLTQAGYQTRAQGKMHFHPMRANYGFEHMELPMDYYRERHGAGHGGLPKQHGLGENEITPVISTVDEAHSLTHWTVRRSIDFLETRDPTRPFFPLDKFYQAPPALRPVCQLLGALPAPGNARTG
jgi:arylsulfatase